MSNKLKIKNYPRQVKTYNVWQTATPTSKDFELLRDPKGHIFRTDFLAVKHNDATGTLYCELGIMDAGLFYPLIKLTQLSQLESIDLTTRAWIGPHQKIIARMFTASGNIKFMAMVNGLESFNPLE